MNRIITFLDTDHRQRHAREQLAALHDVLEKIEQASEHPIGFLPISPVDSIEEKLVVFFEPSLSDLADNPGKPVEFCLRTVTVPVAADADDIPYHVIGELRRLATAIAEAADRVDSAFAEGGAL